MNPETKAKRSHHAWLVQELDRVRASHAELLTQLKDAAQTARNYYALFHDETWKARLSKWDAAIAKAEAR